MQTGIIRAIKIISKAKQSEEELKEMRNEVNILSQIDHPNVMNVYEFWEDESHFYIVTELCTGGELFERIIQTGHFDEE